MDWENMYSFKVKSMTTFHLPVFSKENLMEKAKNCFPTFVDGIPSKSICID